MSASPDRLSTAQAILDRQIHWISSADSKAGFVVAIDTALFAGLSAIISQEGEHLAGFTFFVVALAASLLALSVVLAALVVRPRTDGPRASLFFFVAISAMERETYQDALDGATDTELLRDCAAQIHRNAEIATKKHKWASRAMLIALLAGAVWSVAVAIVVWK